jgi:hypothetical protein
LKAYFSPNAILGLIRKDQNKRILENRSRDRNLELSLPYEVIKLRSNSEIFEGRSDLERLNCGGRVEYGRARCGMTAA